MVICRRSLGTLAPSLPVREQPCVSPSLVLALCAGKPDDTGKGWPGRESPGELLAQIHPPKHTKHTRGGACVPVCACPCLRGAAAGGASTHRQCSQGFWTLFSEVPVGRVHVRVLAWPQHVGGGRSVCARGDGTDGRYIWNVSVCVREGEVFASACWRCQHVGGTGICLCPQEVPLAMLSLGPDQELQAVPWRQVSHPSIGWHGRVGCTVYPRLPAEKVFFCISSWVHAFIMTILLQPPGAAADAGGRAWPFSNGDPRWP